MEITSKFGSDNKLMETYLLINEVHGKYRLKLARPDTEEPDQRHLLLHRRAQPTIVLVIRIHTTPLVAEKAIGSDCILIRPIGTLAAINCTDRKS